MRHGKKNNHLSRTHSHRTAMLSNMASSLILSKRIETTVAKAKELRKYVEPLLTRAKDDSYQNRRVVFSYLQNKETMKELFNVVSDKISNRPGGYTRIIKLGNRLGDNAETCIIELVDFNETMLTAVDEQKATRTRRGRRGGRKADETVAAAPVAEAKTETAPAVEAAPEAAADDLALIEGVGPKIAEVLVNAGVTTFAQVADMTPEAIKEILDNAGSQFASHTPETWPQQAALARDGKFDELKTLQDELNGGRPS
ncbi:50S ribosomal protein L17 [Larkinella humicola]|uniref:Large ribosomal subunit protein bL17 n=1 Tax=Larkinella humicola TaxID=2607654 RepID=A0A5N1JIY1_9BACT|nr:50S ribosomal protein L17 [Larkinella humicola]KAA9353760.1 50S ribosomal protein L17 [Larkinella humicola]